MAGAVCQRLIFTEINEWMNSLVSKGQVEFLQTTARYPYPFVPTNPYPYPWKFADIRKYLSVDTYPHTSGNDTSMIDVMSHLH